MVSAQYLGNVFSTGFARWDCLSCWRSRGSAETWTGTADGFLNELNAVMGDTVKWLSATSDSALALKMLSERVAEVVNDSRI